MEILKLFVTKFLLGYLLQSCIAILTVYAFNKRKVDFTFFPILTVIFAAVMYLTRTLPLNFGVHTLISLIVLILMGAVVLKANILKTALAALVVTISIIIFEVFTAMAVKLILSPNDSTAFFADEFNKAVAIIPSNILFFIIIYLVYYFNTRTKKEEK